MKHITKKLISFLFAVILITAFATATFASAEGSTIDSNRKGSITLFKYDITSAERDNAWKVGSYVSTGVADPEGVAPLSPYALQGVEFTYVKVADLATVKENGVIQMGYVGLDDALLGILGMSKEAAYGADEIQSALSASLMSNKNETKNALEEYAKANGTAMAETDTTGKTSASELPLGLYLLVETLVPENVVSTTSPFLLSLPMTSVDGEGWNYDITVYPKNETGMPTLEKTVRESANSTGKTEDYAHTATASVGDVLEYRIKSDLPAISSAATYLTTYTFADTISEGITYNKNNVVICILNGETPVTAWTKTSGMFTVTYENDNTMTIEMTASGLDAINKNYSEHTLEIYYTATLNDEAILGNVGNDNEVILTWKRTNEAYFDTLNDCCHVFSYGINITKEFSDSKGNFAEVEFIVKNETDNYFVVAENIDGVWSVTGFVADKESATHFIPSSNGIITIKGVENDTYIVNEVKTDKDYTTLKEDITVVISASEREEVCNVCTSKLTTATATVNGENSQMLSDGESVNAYVAFKVVNNKGIPIPETGDSGTWFMTIIGIMGIAAAVIVLFSSRKKATN